MTTTAAAPAIQFKAISFGRGHGPAPQADLILDVSDWFRDPHISPSLRKKTGKHRKVISKVLSTPGVVAAIQRLFDLVAVFVDLNGRPFTLAICCVGGRHRSVVITAELARLGLRRGWRVEVEHRDVGKDVLVGARREGLAPLTV